VRWVRSLSVSPPGYRSHTVFTKINNIISGEFGGAWPRNSYKYFIFALKQVKGSLFILRLQRARFSPSYCLLCTINGWLLLPLYSWWSIQLDSFYRKKVSNKLGELLKHELLCTTKIPTAKFAKEMLTVEVVQVFMLESSSSFPPPPYWALGVRWSFKLHFIVLSKTRMISIKFARRALTGYSTLWIENSDSYIYFVFSEWVSRDSKKSEV
jgi:hypothetical protein